MQVIWNILARVFVLCMLISAANDCNAHDKWANGAPVPEWIKHQCCSSDEGHDLTVEMGITAANVHVREGGEVALGHNGGAPAINYVYYRVDGFVNEVMQMKVYPSQDGHVWAFYSPAGPPQATIWCLFVPCISNPDMPTELDSSCS